MQKTIFREIRRVCFCFLFLLGYSNAFALSITVNSNAAVNNVYTVLPGAYTISFTGCNGIAQIVNNTTNQILLTKSETSGSILVTGATPGTYSYTFNQATPGIGPGIVAKNFSVVVSANPTVVIHPKYVVLGVTYAPPGTGSSVQYSNTNLIGSTLTDKSSYENGTTISYSLSASANIFSIVNGTLKVSGSTEASQTFASSSSATVTTALQSSYKLGGMPLPASNQPSTYYTTINHDYDVIWVWLNPVAMYTAPSVGNIQFNGFAYDGNDPVNGMDVIPVQVGMLNGDIPMSASVAVAMSKNWEVNVAYPAGAGAGLTSADYAAILASDPFSSSGYVVNPGVANSADGRFSMTTPNANGAAWQTVSYIPGNLSESFSDTYSQSATNESSTAQSKSVTFGIEVSLQGNSSMGNFTSSLATSNKQTWTNTTTQSITNTSTSVASFTIVPPATGVVYNGPTTFEVYQDNTFGTFMFNPVR